MKRFILVTILAALASTVYSADNSTNSFLPDIHKPFRIFLRMNPGYVIGSTALDLKQTLPTVPDQLSSVFYGFDAYWYFYKIFGINAGYDFTGFVKSQKKDVTDIQIIGQSRIFGGASLLFPVIERISQSQDALSFDINLRVSGGLNLLLSEIHSDYSTNAVLINSAFPLTSGLSTGLGWYAGGGVEVTFDMFTISGGLYYHAMNGQYPGAAMAFTQNTLEIPILLGITF